MTKGNFAFKKFDESNDQQNEIQSLYFNVVFHLYILELKNLIYNICNIELLRKTNDLLLLYLRPLCILFQYQIQELKLTALLRWQYIFPDLIMELTLGYISRSPRPFANTRMNNICLHYSLSTHSFRSRASSGRQARRIFEIPFPPRHVATRVHAITIIMIVSFIIMQNSSPLSNFTPLLRFRQYSYIMVEGGEYIKGGVLLYVIR